MVKEALSELLGEIPAFLSLMKLPPPGSEGATQGSQGAEGALSLPGPSGSGTGKVVASLFMYMPVFLLLSRLRIAAWDDHSTQRSAFKSVVSHADS